MPEVAARRSARGSTHWKWKVDLRTRPILTQSSLFACRAAVSVHAVAARVCDTGGFQQRAIYQAAHLLPVALNRQTDKGDLAVEKRRKKGKEEARQKKNRRICPAVREEAKESFATG